MTDPIKVVGNIKAYKAAIAAGTHTQKDLDDYLSEVHAERTGKPFVNATPDTSETAGDRAVGALSAGYQGLTFGAGNKITAGIRAISSTSGSPYGVAIRTLIGDKAPVRFSDALKENTGVLEDYRERHPIEAGAVELAGSLPTVLATGGGGAKAIAGAPKVGRLAQLGKFSAQGAGYGATAGGLSANRLEDVLPGAAKGAAIGAVAAPVIGHIAGSLGRVASSVIPETLGGTAARRAVGASPTGADAKAAGLLSSALQKGGVDPATVAVPTHSPTSMMELGSRNVPAVVRQARNVPTSNAGQVTDRFLNERAVGAGRRIEEGLTTGTGRTATDVQEPVEQLIERRAKDAKPLYEQAHAHGEIQNPETIAQIDALRKHPDFAAAWERGQRLDALEHPSADVPAGGPNAISRAQMQALKKQGLDTFIPSGMKPSGPTVAQVNAWKKGLDAMIESRSGSANALSRSEARIYRQKLNDVLGMVDEEVPAFKAARQSFKGNSELADAAEQGADHFKPSVSADYLKRTLPEMTAGEQDAYRANALNAVVQKVRTLAANEDLPEAARGVNIVQRLFGTHEAGQKLRMLFTDDVSYESFLGQMEQEALYPKTGKFLQGQSTTAAQLAESEATPGMWRDAGLAATTGSPFAKARLMTSVIQKLRGIRPGMQPAVADAVAQHSTKTGAPLEAMLRKMAADNAKQIAARKTVSGLIGNTSSARLGAHTPFP